MGSFALANLQGAEEFKPAATPAAGHTAEAELAIKGFTLPQGFKCELVAAEPLLANPVAFTIDEQGRFYIAETFRLNAGVPDIRGRMRWLDVELASTSVGERVAYTKRFEPDNQAWWTNKEDRISLLWDSDGDGRCDKSGTFAGGFNGLAEGIGSGVLARGGDVYYTDIPNLWRLRDTNHDGIADVRQSLSYGYGVRYGFIGHDLHGLCLGPDGRLYFSIGDRGTHIVLPDGRALDNSECGAVYRCELDGANLEIIYTGLRNPQELAFDDYGNLWTCDNNSDAGDPARVVYLAEGGDSGWRIGWQFIERPMARGSWLAERLCYEDFPGRAAYALPPVSAKVGNGPSGLTFDPGIGLPPQWRGRFFLANFSGNPNSGIYAFTVRPKGAGFELGQNERFWWNFLPTDVDFGYDGCLYASDWINGWGGTGKGRIYRLYATEEASQTGVTEVKGLFAVGFEHRADPELVRLLAHPDRRVRREAQFALVAHNASRELAQVAASGPTLLARLHALWGLGQIARTGKRTDFKTLLADPEPEIRAQSAKMIGEASDARFHDPLARLLSDSEPRVRYFASLSLAKLRQRKSFQPVVAMLRRSGGDPWLRHAGVMALVSCASEANLTALNTDASIDVRLAAVVALRRLASPKLEHYLADHDPRIIAEAARAINDLPVAPNLPALAGLADHIEKFANLPGGTREEPAPRDAILRRLVNANLRLGTPVAARRLATLATEGRLPETIRLEAISALDDWSKPDGKDRVSGLWRPRAARGDLDFAKVGPRLSGLLAGDAPVSLQVELLSTAGKLQWRNFGEAAFALLRATNTNPKIRVAALRFLGAIDFPRLSEALKLARDSQSEELRIAALRLLAGSRPGAPLLADLEKNLDSGTIREQQSAYALLAAVKDPAADRLLARRLDDLGTGKIASEVRLDLLMAAAGRNDPQVRQKLAHFEEQRSKEAGAAQFTECLNGGDAALGEKIFREKIEAACMRCHKIKGEGGDAAPDLTQIGARADRAYILESITFPNQKVAPGFETLQVVLKDGRSYAGTAKSETADTLALSSPEDGLVTIKQSDIQSRVQGLSGMPENLRELLTKREIRDLVEFLAGLK